MFKINEYISLDLQKEKTVILLGGSKFLICKAVFVDIDRNMKESVYDTIDEVIEGEDSRIFIPISPEEEFWVHCSNLQAWAENNYNTALLHSNIAFPILEDLVGLGDPIAKRVFKDEIVKRITSDHMPVVIYLLNHGYLDIFTDEEFDDLCDEVMRKTYNLDKRLLDLIFISEDFDEVTPLDRLNLKALTFLIEHPKINFFDLLIKFGQSHFEKFRFSILDCLKKLLKYTPDFFREKVELLVKDRILTFPAEKKIASEFNGKIFYENQLDYSDIDDFSIILYLRYKLLLNI